MNIWRCLSDWKEGNNTHYVMVQSPKLLKPAMCLVSLIDLYLLKKKPLKLMRVFFFNARCPFLAIIIDEWVKNHFSSSLLFLLMNIRFKSSCLQSWLFFHHLMFSFIQWLSCIRKVPLPSRQLSSVSLLARFYVA